MVMTVVNQTAAREPETEFKLPSAIRAGQGFWNIDLELQAIKTMLTPTSEWALKVYSTCKLEFFHHSATKSLFVRLNDMMKTADSIDLPSLDFVLSDAQISPAVKKTLHEAFTGSEEHPAVSIVQSQGDFDVLVSGLASLAKTRSIYSATQKAATQLRDSDTPSDLVGKITSQLGDSLFSEEAEFLSQLTMGKGYNQQAEDVFNRIVNGYFDERRIKTGFKEFDERTGGFYKTNLVICSANSGGGKSLYAVNLLKRQFLLGYNVVLVSYEMTDEEVMIRLLSNISEVEMTKIQNRTTTPSEMDRITIAWREFNLQGAKNGNHYTIICPKTDTTVPEIGFRIRSLKPDVAILDYINLLNSSMEGEAQWQQLGNISREAKLLANKLNCVVILLAQLDDTYNLRYSKAIKDHANFVFGWVRDETAINSRVIQVKQMKARNAPLYSFDLIERFDIAQFRDPEQDDRRNWPSKDDLLSLELECQQIGCKLEPSVSKEFDKKKNEELFQKKRISEPVEKVSDVINNNLPFPINEISFATLPVKSKPVSLLKSQSGYEDTV